MGQTNVYAERTVVHVKPIVGSNVDYGFKTPLDSSEYSALGATAFNPADVTPPGVIFGAKYPRPAIYIKETDTYNVSSFADADTVASATPADYRKVKAPQTIKAISGVATTGKSVICVCKAFSDAEPINYAWRMPRWQYTLISGDLPALGIEHVISNTDRKNVCFGIGKKGGTMGFPVPPRAVKKTTGQRISTYYSANISALPTGWTHLKDGISSL